MGKDKSFSRKSRGVRNLVGYGFGTQNPPTSFSEGGVYVFVFSYPKFFIKNFHQPKKIPLSQKIRFGPPPFVIVLQLKIVEV
jgi:hypothetical protein